ncbi:MaoC/PaaZ C-terminal domain-containing protein [Rhodococcus koreensis]|uniref:MaoC/PaaZ C-terminal domain-containing protein n=1 Tax=Rhodococcus koreensis TaxID=99653 RepID=UPI00198135CD|nr:MaoC/PaaZ C-terminal domain-containing protein [Rhodococcus koreensis]QSE86723.1 dehydratase [Rhodococcus koreensis]
MSEDRSTDQLIAGPLLPEIRFGPITRSMLALYAGVSGDHDPVHIDIDFAQAAGHEDVFAHGMLTFGVLARVVSEWCGVERLISFEARFVSITHLHDLITCSAAVIECFEVNGGRRARLRVTALVQNNRTTITGEAVVALDGRWPS